MTARARSRGTARTLGFAAVAALAFAAVALADTKTIQDKNDTPGPIDIKSATAGHTKDGRLKHVIVFYENVPKKGETGNEILEFWTKKPHPLPGVPGAFKEAAYHMQGPQTGTRDVGTGGEDETKFHKTGTVKVTRKGPKLTFIFSKKAIGNPKHAYWWHAKSDYYGPPAECPTGPCEDHAPNGSKAVKHSL
jgi:hypothetical protein